MVVCGYGRVSTDKEDQANSLENQIHYFENEIEKTGNTFYRVYADEGLSGTKMDNRPEFEQMIQDAGIDVLDVVARSKDGKVIKKKIYSASKRKPLFDAIWIKNTSRFARNTLSYEIVNLLRSKNVNIHFITENIDTLDLTQDLLLKLMQVFDENDSKDKSIKVRWGNTESAKRGHIRTNSKLYGYKYNKEQNSLSAIPEEAEVIRRIFEYYASGLGARRICAILNGEHIPTRYNKQWEKGAIQNILRNEKYAGLNNALKYDTGVVFIDKHYPKIKDSYDVTESDRIEPIITKELFYACKKMKEEKTNYKSMKGVYTGTTKFAGLIKCGYCGASYHSNSYDGKKVYNCSAKRKYGRTYCKNPNIAEKALELLLEKLCNGYYNYEVMLQYRSMCKWLSMHIQERIDRLNADSTAKAESIQKQIDELNSKMDGYIELYAENVGIRTSLTEKINQAEAKIKALNDELEEVNKPNDLVKNEIRECYVLLQKTRDKLNKCYSDYQDHKVVSEEDVLNGLDCIIIYDDDGKPSPTPLIKDTTIISKLSGKENWTDDIEGYDENEIKNVIDRANNVLGIVI